mgnify:CR=1 FL=1
MAIIPKLIIISLLSACTSLPQKTENIQKIFKMFSARSIDTHSIEISLEEIENIKYPLIQVKTNDVIKHSVLLPISERNGFKNYISGSKQNITLKGFTITKTHGFNAYLISLEIFSDSHLVKPTPYIMWPEKIKKVYTFVTPLNTSKTIEVQCVYEVQGEEEVSLLKNEIKILKKINENCYGLGFNFKNIYWIDKFGFIWKSRQWISEKNIFADLAFLKL